MNSRERYIETLTFGTPDRIPFEPGSGRKSTKARWHKEGLPEDRNPLGYIRETLGIEEPRATRGIVEGGPGVDVRMIPTLEEKVLEHKNGHYVCQDWKQSFGELLVGGMRFSRSN